MLLAALYSRAALNGHGSTILFTAPGAEAHRWNIPVMV